MCEYVRVAEKEGACVCCHVSKRERERESRSLTPSTLDCMYNMCAALSTHTQHVLVFVCAFFAGRGQHTSEAQGKTRDHPTLCRDTAGSRKKQDK